MLNGTDTSPLCLLTASCFLVSSGKQMTHSQSLAFPHIQHKEINILWNGCSLKKINFRNYINNLSPVKREHYGLSVPRAGLSTMRSFIL